jgi:outer membrane receptor protein involved in Fe transport
MKPGRPLRRHGAGLALLLFSALAFANPREFDIPAGPAAPALTRFAQQAGVPLLFPYDLLQGRRTRALRGRLEVEAALQQLLAGSGLAAFLDARGQITLRLAQLPPAAEEPAEQPVQAPAEVEIDVASEELPEVSITGTRLQRENLSTPTPVAAITRVELDAISPTLLVDALVQLPLFLNSDTPQTQSFGTSGAAGASFLNLRGIGSVRTLTLLDGRRVVPSSRSGTVDVALLPRSVVRRVEVVTGGASAAYGSDAVSGVVNMLLDADFRGLRGHAQAGITERGDNGNAEFGAAWGLGLGERSSLLLSAEYSRIQGIRGYRSRDWFDSTASISNPAAAGPREVLASNVRATGYTYGGLITSGPLAGTQFLAGGVPAPFETGQLRTSTTQSGGSGVDPAADLIWILPDQRRASSFARFSTRPSDSLSTFAQLIAGSTRNAFDKDPPSLWGPWEATIFRDNAFLPSTVRDRMDAAGVSSFRLGRMGADGDLGRAHTTLSGNLLSGTVGANWQRERWALDGYYQIGHDSTRLRYEDTLRIDRVYRGIDAVIDPANGRTVCRSTLSLPGDGCVPVNLFGPGSVSDAARAWITEGNAEQLQDVREQVAEATLHGDTPLLPAGRASLAAGVTWRVESANTRSRRSPVSLEGLRVEPSASQGYRGLPAAYSDTANIFERTVAVDVSGRYSVREIFGEALVPLLRDAPLVRRLDFHGALRQARYSGSGTVLAWKLGAEWQPVESLGLRATRSRDVRAGSLSERFDLSSAGVTIVDQVLAGRPSYAVISQREGNPEVEPELSDTRTAGIIVRPSAWPTFSLTADYYDIRIRDVIALYGTQNIINRCAGGDAAACGLIDRSDTGLITRVHNRILNIAGARSRGIDLEVGWRTPLSWFGGGESLALRTFVTRTLESSTIDATGARIDRAGQTGLFGGAPRMQATLSAAYERGPLNVGLQQRYISSGSYDATFGPQDLAGRHVRAAAYTTLRLGLTPGGRGITWYASVQNLFDSRPPRSGDWGFGGSIPTNEGLFDVLGRRFTAGVRLDR